MENKKTPELRYWLCPGIFDVNFEQIRTLNVLTTALDHVLSYLIYASQDVLGWKNVLKVSSPLFCKLVNWFLYEEKRPSL